MRRTLILLLCLAAAAGCDDGKAKAKAAADKLDKAVDKLAKDEAAEQLAAAKAALAQGTDPFEACSWSAAHPEAAELARLCTVDVPMRHATHAVTAAEQARAAQPEAPSLTECSSDEWTKAKGALDRAAAGDAAWTALVARWAKVCPGA